MEKEINRLQVPLITVNISAVIKMKFLMEEGERWYNIKVTAWMHCVKLTGKMEQSTGDTALVYT